MKRSANVTSIDAVEMVASALRRFQNDASNALDDVRQQVRRAVEWIQHEQRDYWAREVRRNSEQVAEAKVNLQRCLTFRRIGDYQPACREEKKALEKAKRRLHVAEQKVKAVRHWSRAVERAVYQYKSGASQLARWLEVDLSRAVAALQRMGRALEAYIAETSSVDAAAVGEASSLLEEDGGDAADEVPPNEHQQSPGKTADQQDLEGIEGSAAEEP